MGTADFALVPFAGCVLQAREGDALGAGRAVSAYATVGADGRQWTPRLDDPE